MSPSLSPPNRQLVDILSQAQGEPVSGRLIGRALSISRAAVWKRVESLRKSGFHIESIPRQGYVLVAEPDTPSAQAVALELNQETLSDGLFVEDKFHFFTTLDSTNEKAGALARGGALDGTVVVADHQSRGKGRLGRVWDSPAGVNLYFSLILRPTIEPRFAAQLTLLTGLALAETVSSFGADSVEIKWPNDLLLGGKKLAGILTEMAVEESRIQFVVVGVGVNVNVALADLAPEVSGIAATLWDHLKKKVKRSAFLADFLNRFRVWYRHYLADGFAPIRTTWLQRSRIAGRRVQVNLVADSFTAFAVDLDSEGFLIVKKEESGQETRVLAGDVMLLDASDCSS
ncbi:MAG: biotin--[acetyl-CoA-carboxylase] ligase [Magnetococcales bacterium]|nr:biotin--[acetyl-CoA-carboxylase] ligase [Magnetococcales bacterium]